MPGIKIVLTNLIQEADCMRPFGVSGRLFLDFYSIMIESSKALWGFNTVHDNIKLCMVLLLVLDKLVNTVGWSL